MSLTNEQNKQASNVTKDYSSLTPPNEQRDHETNYTPTLKIPGPPLTESEHEDNLTDSIDALIHAFLSRPSARSPYRANFRWTFDGGEPKLSYSVAVVIETPSPLT